MVEAATPASVASTPDGRDRPSRSAISTRARTRSPMSVAIRATSASPFGTAPAGAAVVAMATRVGREHFGAERTLPGQTRGVRPDRDANRPTGPTREHDARQPGANQAGHAESGSSRWVMLVVMCAGYFLVLDVTIVNVALPRIGSGLGAQVSGLQWVVDGYAIALAAVLLTGGTVGAHRAGLGRQQHGPSGRWRHRYRGLRCTGGIRGERRQLHSGLHTAGLAMAALFLTATLATLTLTLTLIGSGRECHPRFLRSSTIGGRR